MDRGSLQLNKTQNLKIPRDIASRGDLSSRVQSHHRMSTAMPTTRSFRNSTDIDPLTQLKMRKEDNWNKIIQFNQKMHQVTLQEAQEKKKQLQNDMRNALQVQLMQKQENKNNARQSDTDWMKQNIDKVNKEISNEELKQRDKRMKLQKVNVERMEDAQRRQIRVTNER